ncbi:MAG: hypothetical protein H0W30_09160 [Gemmatimonadaceae bacterium]|nr:hypothetical protein [Gemmatimonadaceae bacterium]
MKTRMAVAVLALVSAGCSPKADDTSADTAMSDSTMMSMRSDSMEMSDDPDAAAQGGTGVPAGFVGRTDGEGQKLTDVRYKNDNGAWEIWTGPHHIVYSSRNTASGTYRLETTIDQVEAPAHPESFGVFFGGTALDQPGIKYSYFMVRGTGEYLVKTRDGAGAKNVVAWKAADGIPKADASGKGSYKLAVNVGSDSVRFMVNEKQVGSLAKKAVYTDGIAGIRVGHNLHVRATPVMVSAGK